MLLISVELSVELQLCAVFKSFCSPKDPLQMDFFTLETKAFTDNLVTSSLSLLRQGVSGLDNPQSVMFSLLWVFSQKPWLCLLPAAADRCTSGQS